MAKPAVTKSTAAQQATHRRSCGSGGRRGWIHTPWTGQRNLPHTHVQGTEQDDGHLGKQESGREGGKLCDETGVQSQGIGTGTSRMKGVDAGL